MNHLPPSLFIKLIRESFIGSVDVYTMGSCIRFARILVSLYPGAQGYWSHKESHMITKIGRWYYDINGRINPGDSYNILNEKIIAETVFSLYNFGIDCPACDEPVCWELDAKTGKLKGGVILQKPQSQSYHETLNIHDTNRIRKSAKNDRKILPKTDKSRKTPNTRVPVDMHSMR